MFKNATIYRLRSAHTPLLAGSIAAHLAPAAFTPCAAQQPESFGFVAGGAGLVANVQGQLFLCLCVERRPVPAEALKRLTDEKCAALAEAQGFAPSKKARREIREFAADELTAKAIPVRSFTDVWINPGNGWLVVDTSTPARADLVIKLLLQYVPGFPVESFRVQRAPIACMTQWLQEDEAPHAFTIDQDVTVRAVGESRATVQYKRHAFNVDEMRRHFAAGKQCARLALTWRDRLSFVLDESLTLRSIKPSDAYARDAADLEDDDAARWLMAAELRALFADLTDALGGEARA
jgi:recombination associated protein RdgC